MILTKKYYDSTIPKPSKLNQNDNSILKKSIINKKIENLIKNFKFREACNEFMNIARLGNKYLADEEPWKIINTNPDRVKTIIFISIQISSILSIISEPFIPLTSKKIKDMLNYKAHKNSWTWDKISKKIFNFRKYKIKRTYTFIFQDRGL